jgi:hypothetical protein
MYNSDVFSSSSSESEYNIRDDYAVGSKQKHSTTGGWGNLKAKGNEKIKAIQKPMYVPPFFLSHYQEVKYCM